MVPKDWAHVESPSWAIVVSNKTITTASWAPAGWLVLSMQNPADLVESILSWGLDSLGKTYGEILRDCAVELRGGKHSDARRYWQKIMEDVYEIIRRHRLISLELERKIQSFAGHISRPHESIPNPSLSDHEAILALCFFMHRAEGDFAPYYHMVAEKLCEMYPDLFD